jgi:hypothetical protein
MTLRSRRCVDDGQIAAVSESTLAHQASAIIAHAAASLRNAQAMAGQ